MIETYLALNFVNQILFLVSCCNEVVVSTSTAGVSSAYLGTYTYNTEDDLVGDRKIFKKGDRCLYYYSSIQKWLMVSCGSVGSGSA